MIAVFGSWSLLGTLACAHHFLCTIYSKDQYAPLAKEKIKKQMEETKPFTEAEVLTWIRIALVSELERAQELLAESIARDKKEN